MHRMAFEGMATTMQKYFRRVTALLVLAPGLAGVYALSLFTGRERAIQWCGPFFTRATRPFARSWVPKIESAADFEAFSTRMKSSFWRWKPFFDFSIVRDDSEVFELKITYCPICDVIKTLGLSELAPFVCEADWQVADDNKEKWLFRREYQLSTGDPHCNHTYGKKT